MKTQNLKCVISLFCLITFGLIYSNLFSQSLTLGIKGGISIPNLEGGGTPQSEGYSSRLAPTFGAFITRELNPHFAIQGEISYSGQGGKRDGMQIIFEENLSELPVPQGTALYADFDNETIINYLEIPILACYSIVKSNSGFEVYLNAGPYLGIMLDAKVVTDGTSTIYLDKAGTMPLEISGFPLPAQDFDTEVDISDKLNTFNAGITGGLGLNYNYSKHQLKFDVRGIYGFIPIQKDEENGSNKTGALYITLGYGYNF
ncbi:MAG: porin family protein [Calditrichaceae bacterium]|jgi:hypothetical protein